MDMFTNPELNPELEAAFAAAELEERDLDKTGKLSFQELYLLPEDIDEEFKNYPQTDFNELDKDHDGELDVEELKAHTSYRHYAERSMLELVEHADADKDGLVTLKELLKSAEGLT